MPSFIRTTYRVQVTIQCHCSAYKFPHSVGINLCSQRIDSSPDFHPPKKGLASKIDKLLTLLESVEDEVIKEIVDDFNVSTRRRIG